MWVLGWIIKDAPAVVKSILPICELVSNREEGGLDDGILSGGEGFGIGERRYKSPPHCHPS